MGQNIPDTLRDLLLWIDAAGNNESRNAALFVEQSGFLKRNIILKRRGNHFADASKMIFSLKYPRCCRKISEISKNALFAFLLFHLFKHGSCIPRFSYSRVRLCPSSRHHRSRTSMRP